MKKSLLLITACILTIASAYSQPISVYEAENTVGTYEEITGGTSIGEIVQAEDYCAVLYGLDGKITSAAENVKGFPIGFDFKYDNKYMNQFLVGPGFIMLGKDGVSVSSVSDVDTGWFTTLFTDENSDLIGSTIINGFGGLEDTEVTYSTIGEEPNRELVVQFKNIGANISRFDYEFVPAQIQIRLHEDTGNIDMIFQGLVPNDYSVASYVSWKIGIRGEGTDYITLNSFTGSSLSVGSASLITWSSSSYPEDGQTVTFIAPEDCTSPSSPATDLVLNSGSNYISGSFTASEDADHYLVLVSEDSELSDMPVDETLYSAGDVIGNATVVSYGTSTSFTSASDLSGATTYNVFVFPANAACMFGPKFLTTNILTASTATMPAQPEEMTVDAGVNDVTINITGNDNNDKVVIAATTESLYDSIGQMTESGVFGTPEGDMNIGDEIDGGGTVVYVGEAQNGILVSDLTENSLYHFQAWSIDGNGSYSTTYLEALTATGGTVPFTSNFGMMPLYYPLAGWDTYGDFETTKSSSDSIVVCNVTTADEINGTINYISTPWIQLGEGSNRVIMDLNMTIYQLYSNSVYNEWAEGDQLLIQVTPDEENYTTICEYNKDNVPQFTGVSDFTTLYMPFDEYSGQKVKVRIYWNTFTSPKLQIKSIKVEEIADCDYPINLAVVENSISGDKATLDWDRQGNENAWEIRYKLSDSDEWYPTISVDSKPYTLSGLPAVSEIDAQVRAKCDENSQSEWSNTVTFHTGYSLPYTETFSQSYGEPIPDGWEFLYGELGNPTEFTGESSVWAFNMSSRVLGLYFYASGTKDYNDWLEFPTVDMGDGSVNYILTIDVTGQGTRKATDDTYQILMSNERGVFSEADVVATFSGDDLPQKSKTYATLTVPLKGYEGEWTPALYIHATDGCPSVFSVNSISIDYSCPSDIENVEITDTTETSVNVSWETEADESYIFIRKAGETDKPYIATTEKSYEFTDLDSRTDYEIGITKKCDEDDMAKVTIVSVTTLAPEGCQQVTDINAEPSKYEATITWEGDASAYNVRYRKSADTDADWTIVTVTDTCVVLTDLEDNTEYAYGIQSMCSTLEDDISEYTDDLYFTTLVETCLAPENITITPSYYSALVTWEGDAAYYQLAYSLKGTDEWTEIETSDLEYNIENLYDETEYTLRMKSVCSDEDSGKWTDEIDFSTLALPECITPSDLTVSEITDNSALLSWTADEANLSWNIHYRKGSDSQWTEVDGIAATQYELTDLDEESSYLWSVMAECEYTDSNWATQNRFSTTATGINNVNMDGLKVFVNNQILNIYNPENSYISTVSLYSVSGQLIKNFMINASENVFIPLNAYSEEIMIVKVAGKDTVKTIKLGL